MASDVSTHTKAVSAALPTVGISATVTQLPTGTTHATLAAKLGMPQDVVQAALRELAIRY